MSQGQSQEALNQYVIGVIVDGGEKLKALEESLRKIADLNKKAGAGTTSTSASQKAAAANTRSIGRAWKHSERQLDSYNKQFRLAASQNKNDIADMFRRVTLWSSGIGILFGSIAKIRQVFQATNKLEMSMVELHKVMSDDTPFKKVRENLFKTAKEYSVAIDKTAQVATVWAQQGKNYLEVAALTRSALMGVNSANLEAAQSVEFLTSITKSYNIEAERTVGIMDGIMRVQANFAITAASLARGFLVVGKTASLMGDDIGTVFGMITAIGQVTRESGNVVGTSLKTQIARINKPETLKYLESKYGIKTISEGTGHTASYRGLMSQIAALDLGKEQKIDIAKQIGGIRKYKDVLALMDQWNTAEAARMKSLYAYNDAAKANELVQNTLIKKLEKLGIVFTDFGSNALEQSFIPALKLSVDGISYLGEQLAKLSKTSIGKEMTGALPATVIALGAGALGRTVGRNLMYQSMSDFGVRASEYGSPIPKSGTATGTDYALGLTTERALKKEVLTKDIEKLKLDRKIAAKQGENALMRFNMAQASSALLASQQSGIKGLSKEANILRKNYTVAKRGLSAGFQGAFGIDVTKTKDIKSGTSLLKTAALTQSIGSIAGNILKMTAIMTIINLGLTGIIALGKAIWSGIEGKPEYKTPDVNIGSEASKAFFGMTKDLEAVKKAADRSGISIKDYIKTLSYSEKETLLLKGKLKGTKINEGFLSIADRINKKTSDGKYADDAIRYIHQLQTAFKEMGFEAGDYNKTLEILTNVWKYLDNETLKSSKKLRESLLKQKEEIFAGFENRVKFSSFDTGLSKDQFSAYKEALKHKDTGGAYDIISKRMHTVAKNSGGSLAITLIDGFVQSAKENYNKQITSKTKDQLFGVLNILASSIDKEKSDKLAVKPIRTMGIASRTSMFINEKKAFEELNKLNGDQLDSVIDKVLKNIFIKRSPQAVGEAGISKVPGAQLKEEVDIIAKFKERFDPAMEKFVDSIYANVPGFKKFKKQLEALGYNFKDSFKNFEAELSSLANALKNLKDPIYGATVDFKKKLKDIEFKSDNRFNTGVGIFKEKEQLKALRDYANTLNSVSTSLVTKQEKARSRLGILEAEMKKADKGILSEFSRLQKEGEARGIRLNDKTAYAKFAKQQYAGKSDEIKADYAKDWFKLKGELARLTNVMKIVEGKRDLNASDYTGVVADIGKLLGVSFNKNQSKTLELALKQGGITALTTALSELKNVVIKKSFEIKLLDLAPDLQKNIASARTKATTMFGTGNKSVDALELHKTALINIGEEYKVLTKIEEKRLSDLYKSSDDEYIAGIKILEQREKNAIAVENLNYSLTDMNIKLQAAQQVTQMFTSATVDFLSTTQNFRFDKSKYFDSGFRNYLSGLGKNIIQTRMNAAIDVLKAGNKDNAFGQFILGTNVKKPEALLQTATTENTNKLLLLTSSVDALNRTLSGYLNGDSIIGQSLLKPDGLPVFSNKLSFQQPNISNLGFNRDSIIGQSLLRPDGLPVLGFNTSNIQQQGKTETGNWFSNLFKNKKPITPEQQLGLAGTGIATSLISNQFAKNMGKTGDMVGAGQSLGGIIGMTGGPAGAMAGTFIGGIIGAMLSKDEKKDSDNIERIAENTASLKDLDSRLINAPSDFKIPALAKTGGNIQYNGGITIVVQGTDSPQDTAKAVAEALDQGVSTYNTTNGL